MMDWSKYNTSFREQRRNLFILYTGFLLFSCISKEPKIYKNQNVGGALGTSYNIIYVADTVLNYQAEIDSVFAVVNKSLSTYIPDSDISKINKGDTTIVVDHMFKEVFERSKEIYERTKGYFDPTVGTLVNAWGFGPGKQIQLDSARVDSLMQYVGFDKVALQPSGQIKKTRPEIQFDFNAIAKGYAIDRLAKMLDAKGVQNYLIEVGGELVAKGENTLKKKPWSVGIDDPQAEVGRENIALISLKDRAMASSGNYRKFRIDSLTGKKYVHSVNPLTGFTKSSTTLAANVLANDCATADAYATAFMIMQLDEAIRLVNSEVDLEAYIIYLDENGETMEFMSAGFKELVQ